MSVQLVEWVSAGLTTSVTAYTSGDVLGTESTVPVIGHGSLGGVIVGAQLIDASAGLGAVDLFIFSAASTPAADNAANSWSDANILKLVGVVQLTNIYTSALNKIVDTGTAAYRRPFFAPTGSLYVTAVTRTGNAVFGAVGDVTYRMWLEK